MKKIILIAAAALLIGAAAANAQDPTMDTTKMPRRSTQETPQKSSDQMKQDKTRHDANKPAEDKMEAESRHQGQTLVRPSEIPAALRQSLQGADYTGWESGRVYRTREGEYLVEIKKNGLTRLHRFDANGKPVKE